MTSISQRRPSAGCALCRLIGGGFTLIELLITMALIIIMFVMLYGSSSRSYQRKQKMACEKNLQTIYVSLQIYGRDHGGTLPISPGATSSEAPLSLLVPQYTSLTAPFICPGSGDDSLPEGESFAERKISYAYYMGHKLEAASEVLMTDEQVNALPKIKSQTLFSPDGKKPGNNHNRYGGNLMFGDGHLQMCGSAAPASLVFSEEVVLLNPKR